MDAASGRLDPFPQNITLASGSCGHRRSLPFSRGVDRIKIGFLFVCFFKRN